MATESRRTTLVVIRHTPYGSTLGRTSLDAALAMAAFDQPVSVLFLGDGVLHLLPKQDSHSIGVKNTGKLLASMSLYEITDVFAEAAAIERYGLDLTLAPLPCQSLETADIRALMTSSDHLLGF
jgi:tRNA 2-thiouridine synthesizing protein C